MAMWITINFNFGQRNEPDNRLVSIKALEPKAEQVQPLVQQPDAALSSDEPPGSAAGNPDGESLEAFEAWVEKEDGVMLDYIYLDGSDSSLLTNDEIVAARLAIQKYKRRGAA